MYDTKKVEEEMLKFWEQNKIFDKLRAQNKGKEKFKFLCYIYNIYGRYSKRRYKT